jgi:hypothetical protein
LCVVDMLGKAVLTSNIQSGVTSFSMDKPGMYVVTVSTNGGTWVQKLVVDAH